MGTPNGRSRGLGPGVWDKRRGEVTREGRSRRRFEGCFLAGLLHLDFEAFIINLNRDHRYSYSFTSRLPGKC